MQLSLGSKFTLQYLFHNNEWQSPLVNMLRFFTRGHQRTTARGKSSDLFWLRTGNQWCQVSRHCVALCPSQVLRTCSHLAIHSPHLGLVITFLQPSQYKILHCPRSPAHTLVPQLPPRAPSLGGLFPTTISNATLLPRWTPCA